MDTTARLDLSVWRNDETYEFPLRIVGLDATNVALAMQVRLAPDTPGAPLIDLAKVTNGNAEGVRVAGVTIANGVPTSDVRIRINKSTRQALPYAGEMGDSTPLSYALLIAGITRLVGSFLVLAHSYGSDNAPAFRPAGYGSVAASPGVNSGATLTIAKDGGATLAIDGAGLVSLEAQRSAASAEISKVAAEQTAALLASTGLTRVFATLAAARDGGLMTAATVLIQSDERRGGRPTLGAFDGWDFRLPTADGSLTFAPQDLFASGERGVIVDPSDRSTLWQDRAMTNQVTASGQPVAVMFDKRAPRPDLTKARRNLLFDTSNWRSGSRQAPNLGSILPQMDMARSINAPWFKITETTGNSGHSIYRSFALPGGQITYGLALKAGERSKVRIFIDTGSDYADFDLSTGAAIANSGALTGGITALPNGGWLCTVTGTLAANNRSLGVQILADDGSATYAGDASKGLYIAGEQLVAGAAWGAYQPVGSNVAGWVGGNVLSCDTDAKRPLYIEDDALRALRFDGVDDALWADATDLLSPSASAVTTIVLVAKQTDARNRLATAVHHGFAGFFQAPVGGREVFFSNTTNGALGLGAGAGGSYLFANSTDSTLIPRAYVAIIDINPAGATAADRIRFTVNGQPQSISDIAASGSPVTAWASAIATLSIGGRDHSSIFAQMDLYGFLAINRALTDAEKAALTTYYGPKAGVVVPGPFTYSYTPTAQQFADTAYATDAGGYYRTSPYARVLFDTTANFIRLSAVNDIYGSYPASTELGVYVNGAWYASVPSGALGATTRQLQLPAGQKRVEIVNGPQSRPDSTIVGTYLASINADGPITPVAIPTRATRDLFYGDSIATGFNANPNTRFGHVLQVRTAASAAATPVSVGLEAYGFRSLWEDAGDATKRAALVQRIVAWNPTRLVMEIGTNDFGLNRWSAADFGTAYAAVLNDLHNALPALTIDAVTPLIRSNEAANRAGSTLDDYRNAIMSAASGKLWVTVRNGKAVLATGDLDDGVHPTNAGHAKYATAENAWLGL